MMSAIGDFVFELRSIPFQSQNRRSSYRLAEHLAVGRAPTYQALGQGDDVETLSGMIYPELMIDGIVSIEALRSMMNTGLPHLVMDGNGFNRGLWFIETIDENRSEFTDYGEPKKIEFTIELRNSHETRL